MLLWPVYDGFGFCPNVTFEDDEFKDNKALNDQGKGEGTNCHSPTQSHLMVLPRWVHGGPEYRDQVCGQGGEVRDGQGQHRGCLQEVP